MIIEENPWFIMFMTSLATLNYGANGAKPETLSLKTLFNIVEARLKHLNFDVCVV